MIREVALSVGFVVLVATVPGALAETRHSGTVTSVDAARGTLTIEEIGPSVAGHVAKSTLTVDVTRDTTLDVAERASGDQLGTAGWPGGYRDQPAALEDVKVGETATVTGDERDGRLVARHLTIAVPEQAVQASPRTDLPERSRQ